jgi:hypothetical protein
MNKPTRQGHKPDLKGHQVDGSQNPYGERELFA